MIKTVNFADLEPERTTAMSIEEYRAELAKPRAERRGLPATPKSAICTGEAAVRMARSIARVSSANAAARARGMANARNSATNR